MKVKIKNKNNSVEVTVTANKDISLKESMSTQDVKRYLASENIKVYECDKEDYVNNRHYKCKGLWIFNKQNTSAQPTPIPKKELDNTPKDVVSLPKPRRSRKPRPSVKNKE